jgi:hypothetical protein
MEMIASAAKLVKAFDNAAIRFSYKGLDTRLAITYTIH